MTNVVSALIQFNWTHPFILSRAKGILFQNVKAVINEYHKDNVHFGNKQILFNTFDDSLPVQMPNSTQSKLGLLVSIGFTAKEILVYLQEHCNET